MIICNTRSLDSPLTGIQRYTSEILKRSIEDVELARPSNYLHGIKGHIWEQLSLPRKIGGKMLWSPANTGPLSIKNQVVSIMDMAPLDHPEWSSLQFSTWYGFLLPKLIGRVKAVLTISEFSRARILHYCPDAESKIFITPLAVDPVFKPGNADDIDRAISELSLPSPHYLLALGSLEPRKNLKTLLAAWRHAQQKLPDNIWLVLAGGIGSSRVFASHSFGELPPRVHMTGHVDDKLLPALYSGAISSLYLSYYEGFGLPPLESLACGTPVIASNISSLQEVVGAAGLLVNPYDEDEIAFNILRVVEDSNLRSHLSQSGIDRSKLFNWDKTALQTWNVLNQCQKA